jgi:hypothetical protein
MVMKGTIRVDGNSAINEISGIDKNTLKVYPSPFNNILNIDFSLTEGATTIVQILDLTGKLVYTENANSFAGENKISIDLSALTPGFYFMVLNRGKETYAERIIKM